MGDNPQNENHKYLGKFAILFLISVLLIAVYTLILQKNYSESTLKAEVQRDSDCSDAIHKVITDKLTKEDFENINAKSDMKRIGIRITKESESITKFKFYKIFVYSKTE